jgi:transcriptional regulator with XRE-family HTH domain
MKETSKSNNSKYNLGEMLASLAMPQRKKTIDKMVSKGISYDTISRIRRAKSNDKYTPSADTFRFVADTLNVNMENLFND